MGGGLIQLMARGPQDQVISSCSGVSFFRQVFRRHTSFAIESIDQVFSGQVGYGKRASVTLDRKGDLISNLVLEVTLRKTGDTFYPAEHLLKEVELQIGGQRIDLLTNTWLRMYDELHRPVDSREAYRQMTDFTDEAVGTVKRFFVPIPFWFSRGDASLSAASTALPLIGLQYHEVTLNFEFEAAENIPGVDASFVPEIALWTDYVFVDTRERQWFAHNPQRYLIEQTQVVRQAFKMGATQTTQQVLLPFNHPVKYLAWALKPSRESHGVFAASLTGLESREVAGPLLRCGLSVNGQDRFKPRAGSYFRLQHPFSTFGQAPSVGVYVFSFAMFPSKMIPSGTMNCSRVDSMRLLLTTKEATLATCDDAALETQTASAAIAGLRTVEVFARNYNVLEIRNGMAGLAYAS